MPIKVSYQDLKENAKNFRTERQNILDSINEIKRIMSSINTNNEAESLTALELRFDAFKSSTIENCSKLVEKFAAQLDKAAELYETADRNMKSNVESGVGNKAAFKQ